MAMPELVMTIACMPAGRAIDGSACGCGGSTTDGDSDDGGSVCDGCSNAATPASPVSTEPLAIGASTVEAAAAGDMPPLQAGSGGCRTVAAAVEGIRAATPAAAAAGVTYAGSNTCFLSSSDSHSRSPVSYFTWTE